MNEKGFYAAWQVIQYNQHDEAAAAVLGRFFRHIAEKHLASNPWRFTGLKRKGAIERIVAWCWIKRDEWYPDMSPATYYFSWVAGDMISTPPPVPDADMYRLITS